MDVHGVAVGVVDAVDAEPLAGTEGGDMPFFSPDGSQIGFASEGKLKRVAIAGGTSALSQKVLEAIFGDQAVRALAAKARQELLDRVEGLLGEEAARYERVLGAVAPQPEAAAGLRDAARELERAR